MSSPDPLFAYMNARVRSLKSDLFTRVQVEELLNQNDLKRMADALLDSPYRQDLAEALAVYQGADAIEEAVSRNLAASTGRLLARAIGKPRELLETFLTRWDLSSVKSLLRARHNGLTGDEAVSAVLPAAHLPVALQRRLAECDSMDTLCAQLIAWNSDLCGGLAGALPKYRETTDLAVLEEALDRHYFVRHAARLSEEDDSDSELLHYFMQLEIDRINLRLVFERLRRPGAEPLPKERFLPEGTLPVTMLLRMAQAAEAAEVIELLGVTRYREFVGELYQFSQTRRFSPIERLFEHVLLHELRRLAVRDPLSFAVVMDYTWRKFNEGVNLRLIARGLAGHVPVGRVREELVFL